MKRIFSTILAVMLLMGLMAVPALASGIEIVSSSVLDGDEAAPVSALITFKFSENIATPTEGQISLKVAESDTELVNAFSVSGDTLKIYAKNRLDYNTNYVLNLGIITSSNAYNTLADSEITFKTRYGAEKSTIVEEDFETDIVGTFADELLHMGSATSGNRVQLEGDNGNWSYKIQNGTMEAKDITVGGKVLFEFDMTTEMQDYNFLTLTFDGGTATRRLLRYDGVGKKFGVLFDTKVGGTAQSSTMVAEESLNNGWNNIKALVDLEAQTIKLYVNNKLVSKNGKSEFAFPLTTDATTAGASIIKIQIQKTGWGPYPEVFIDNFSMRQVDVQSPVDSQLCQLTASNPDVNKVVHLGENNFELTFNHKINIHSLENVTINGTVVKSFEAEDNKITVVLPDNYQLEMYGTYTFDFCLAEDIYGCAVPNVTFNTKTNYSMTEVDFEKELDSNVWEIWKYHTLSNDAELKIVEEPGNAGNHVLHFNRAAGADDMRFKTKDNAPFFNINGNAVFGFSIKLNSIDFIGYSTCNFIELYDKTSAPTDKNPDAYNSVSLPWILQVVPIADDNKNVKVQCTEYKSVNNDNAPVQSFKDSGVTIPLDAWVDFQYEFDFEKCEYYAYINTQKTGPYDISKLNFTGIDGVLFNSSARIINYYYDDIYVGQKFFADTDYDFGFFNAEGEEIGTVDPVKTTYKATIVNRGKSADNTKLILTVTDEAEQRLSEVRLINFAELEESKNGENEIIIEEVFSNLGTGKKIKAFYWQDFASLRPSAASTRLLPLVAEVASAN